MADPNQAKAVEGMSDSLLSTIFGADWQNMLSIAQANGMGAPITTMIGSLFSVFNTAVMAITALIVMVVAASAVIQTAHEGQVLGQRYSTIWVPIRIATSAFLMAPVWGGFAMIQVIVMTFAMMSIGIANDASLKMLEWAKEGRPTIVAPGAPRSATSVLRPVFDVELCHAYQEKYNNMSFENKDPITIDKSHQLSKQLDMAKFDIFGLNRDSSLFYHYARPYSTQVFGVVNNIFRDIPGNLDDCGSVQIVCDADTKDKGCISYLNDLASLFKQVPPIVNAMLNDKEGNNIAAQNDAITALYKRYDEAHKKFVETVEANLKNEMTFSNSFQKRSDEMKKDGWIRVGTYYWDLTAVNQRYYRATTTGFDAQPPKITAVDANADKMGGYKEFAQKVDKALASAGMGATGGQNIIDEILDNNGMGPIGKLAGLIAAKTLNVANNIDNNDVMKEDPVQRLMGTGHALINTISGLYIASKIVPAGKATDKATEAGKKTGSDFLSDTFGLMGMIILILFIIGLALAFYIPAIPAIIWVMSVAGWLTMLAQSMVAAPLWAASHAMPEGEGFAGERAKQGYMLLMNVAIRPILLVIGFVLAMGMVWATTWMSQILMSSALKSMISAHDTTPLSSDHDFNIASSFVNFLSQIANVPSMSLGIIAIFVISSVVTILLIHRSFDLIYETADDVMKWIGGSSGPLGGERDNTSKALTMIAGQFNRIEQRMLNGRGVKPQKDIAPAGGGNDPASKDTPKAPSTDGVANQTSGRGHGVEGEKKKTGGN